MNTELTPREAQALEPDHAVRQKMEMASDLFLARFLNFGALSLACFYVIQVLLIPSLGVQHNLLIFLFVVFLPARAVLLTQYKALARWWFVGSFSACVLVLPWFVNGVRTPLLIATPFVLMLVAWFLGRRWLVGFSTLVLVVVLGYWWAERNGLYLPPLPARPIDAWLITYLEVGALTVVALWAMIGNYQALQAVETRLHNDLARQVSQANDTRQQLAEIYDGLSAHVCVLDGKGIILSVNKAWRDFYMANGGSPDSTHEGVSYLESCTSAIRNPSPDLQDAANFYVLLQEVLDGKRNHFEMEYPCHSPTEKRWFFARVSRIEGAKPVRIVVAHDDVTSIKQAQEQLDTSLLFTRSLIESMQEGFSVLDHTGEAFDANPALCRMTGFAKEELVGIKAPFPYWPPEEYDNIRNAFEKTLMGAGGEFELTFMRKNGERFPVNVAASAVKDAHGDTVNYVATVSDISERKLAQEQIHRLAFYDPLTNLANRRLLTDRMGQALLASRRSGKFSALLVLDLDNFKPLNDLHGHAAGDLLLTEVAQRIRSCVREMDTVGRFGGDEFVVLIPDLSQDRGTSHEQLAVIAEKIRLSLSQSYYLLRTGQPPLAHHCSASIGGALLGDGAADAADALSAADQAMYQSKKLGRNRVTLSAM